MASIVGLIILLFSFNVYADSPITSTQFSNVYLDCNVVKNAKESGVLNPETAKFLASQDNPIDQKAAVINALGFMDIKEKDNAEKYAKLILGKTISELNPNELSGNDAFCIGYLLALDDYLHSEKAEPFLERASTENPKSYTVRIITAIVNAQRNLTTPRLFWEEINKIETDTDVINDMRSEAKKIIMDYMDTYGYLEIDKSSVIISEGSSISSNFIGHTGPYKIEQASVYNSDSDYQSIDINLIDSYIKAEISNNTVNIKGVKPGLYRLTFADNDGSTTSIQVLVASQEKAQQLNNSVLLSVNSSKAYVAGVATSVDKNDSYIVPTVISNRTLVPVRFVSENLGATVNWDEAASTATIDVSGKSIKITVASDKMLVDSREVSLDSPAVSVKDRLFIPLRALVEEGLEKKVFYSQGLIVVSDYDSIIDSTADSDIINGLVRMLRQEVPSDRHNNINVLLSTEPPQMNSLLSSDSTSNTILSHVNEGLVRKGKDGKPMSGLAESWDTSKDGLVWTFHLKDSKWSDGTPITAKDFEFSFLQALKKETNSDAAYLFYVFKNGKAYNKGDAIGKDVGIKAVDDKTLVLTLEQPTSYFLELLTLKNFSPINQSFYEIQGSNYGKDSQNLLYSGPWLIINWSHNKYMTLVKNPYYWNSENIKLDEIDFYFSNNNHQKYLGYSYNKLDIVNINYNELYSYDSRGYNIKDYSDGATFYLQFNTKNKILGNSNIRKALSYSIDKNRLIKLYSKYKYQPALSFTNPEVSGKNESFSQELESVLKDGDLAEAKIMLDKGLKELGLNSLPQMSVIVDDTDTAVEDAKYFTSIWKNELGINVKIIPLSFKEKLQKISNKDFQITVAGWSADFNDPISFLEILETNNGPTGYSNPEYDSLLDQIRRETDASKRMDMLEELEKIINNDMPVAPLYYRHRYYVDKPYVQGLVRRWGQDLDLYWTSLSN